jgi:hypothetical protein
MEIEGSEKSPGATTVNVICMKWGHVYGPEYVNNLYAGVTHQLKRPHRFVCFTDDPFGLNSAIETFPLPNVGLPPNQKDTRWQKLGLFGRTLADLEGTALFLDLDVIIVDDLGPFFDLPGAFRIIRDDELFRSKPLRKLNPARDRFLASVGNSSVFRFQIGAHSDVLDEFISNPEEALANFEISQQFQSARLASKGLLDYWPREWCVSFKNQCVSGFARSFVTSPKLPKGARIVVFAGSPKMSEVFAGGGQKWYRHIGNIEWLRKAWQG